MIDMKLKIKAYMELHEYDKMNFEDEYRCLGYYGMNHDTKTKFCEYAQGLINFETAHFIRVTYEHAHTHQTHLSLIHI